MGMRRIVLRMRMGMPVAMFMPTRLAVHVIVFMLMRSVLSLNPHFASAATAGGTHSCSPS
jgi:hypothetical protein